MPQKSIGYYGPEKATSPVTLRLNALRISLRETNLWLWQASASVHFHYGVCHELVD